MTMTLLKKAQTLATKPSRKKWTEEEVQMIKENWWWTPDLAAYYIPEKTGIHRSVKAFARKQKQVLGSIPTNNYDDY